MIESVPHSMLQMLMKPFLFAQETNSGVSMSQIWVILAVAVVVILPFMLGKVLAKTLKMPTHDMRIGIVLFAIIASTAVLLFGKLGYGVDLRGGTILVYELDPKAMISQQEGGGDSRVSSADVIPALTKRLNPSGTQEIVIRPYGDDQIEIIIPDKEDAEVQSVKRQITEAGILRFAILANRDDHRALIEAATDGARSTDRTKVMGRSVTDSNGRVLGFWADVDREDADVNGIAALRVDISQSICRDVENGQLVQIPVNIGGGKEAGTELAIFLKEQGIRDLQTLMVLDEKLQITGEDLSFVSQGYDQDGSPSVRFSLKDAGSSRFYALTMNNIPKGGRKRQLGIVLDNRLLSAPSINNAIKGDGTISGNFTIPETQFLVNILRAGQLPAALNKVPISENQIGSTLGADTIRKGVTAIVGSLIAVLLFVLFYYRFAGLVACIALIMNLVMTFAVMMLINQPITLPGFAGLVLTVGMSVDANVLIFERIREEVKRGSAPRLAVRNGFSRATTTIIDSNLTTLITAIVLYAIGTDQIRGFAATLILGILFSMFTAIYVSRTIFDIAERRRFLSLGMSDMVMGIRNIFTGNKDFDFMGKGTIATTFSLILMAAGVGALVMRGKEILDIDFAGGASVTFQLDKPVPADDVRKILESALKVEGEGSATRFTLNRVDVATAPDNTVYKVDSDLADDDDLKSRLIAGFAASDTASLVTYRAEIQVPTAPAPAAPNAAVPEEVKTGYLNRDLGVQLVSTFAQDPTDEPATSDEGATEPDEALPPAGPVVTAPENPVGIAPPATLDAASNTADAAAVDVTTNDAGNRVETTQRIISESSIKLSVEGSNADASIDYLTLRELTVAAAKKVGIALEAENVSAVPSGEGAEEWTKESSLSFSTWKLTLDMAAEKADLVVKQLVSDMGANPVWLSSNEISGRVAGQMIQRAVMALFASLIFIVGYIWFRFQRVAFGFAAVVALVHDVVITLGAIAVSYWLAGLFGFLLIDQFKISLTVVAALLTIVGYSLNDTIVVFDRIREVRGKSPRLTSEMINLSVNQTLSRTLLTSGTTLIVVLLMYLFGGEGIHAFAFSLVIGITVGTYSSIFIASPVLLWLVNRSTKTGNAIAVKQ